eukprot:97119-Prymnesium_polylepis.1
MSKSSRRAENPTSARSVQHQQWLWRMGACGVESETFPSTVRWLSDQIRSSRWSLINTRSKLTESAAPAARHPPPQSSACACCHACAAARAAHA